MDQPHAHLTLVEEALWLLTRRGCAGSWVVIEANDAQESGFAGVPALPMWRQVIDLTRATPG
jgi:hypothetical protein